MRKKKLTHSEIEFELDKTKYQFDIVHNLPETPGLSIGDALQNWTVRVQKGNITDKAFCAYIMSKDVNFMAMPKKDFDKLAAK